MSTNQHNRESFGSRWGFILACIGSAVGMGNIWMFPTRVSLYGGGSFLIPYIFFVVVEETHRLLQISSDYSADADVEVSSKTFSEIIMDIASGMSVNTAFERQGYTYQRYLQKFL